MDFAQAYRESTAWVAKKIAGAFKLSKKKAAALSLFLRGLSGASVMRIGCWVRGGLPLRGKS